jgi:hypothetical protein
MFELGIARSSRHRRSPLMHLLVPVGGVWHMWCSSGSGLRENPLGQRRCPRCAALARQDLVANLVQPDDATNFDWYLGRVPTAT